MGRYVDKPFHWAGAAHLILAAARRLGIDKARVLERAGLRETDLPPSQGRIRWSVLRPLTAAALELTAEPALGLLAGRIGTMHANGVIGAYYMHLSPVRTAQLFAYEEVFPRQTNLIRFRHQESAARVLNRGEVLLPADPLIDVHLHLFLGMHITYYRALFGEFSAIGSIGIRSTSVGDPESLSALIGCRVETGQAGDWVAVPGGMLERQVSQSNPWLREQLKPQLDALLRALDEGRDTTLAVRTELERGLGNDAPLDLLGISTKLGLKARTLRARLAAEGTTFSALLDTTRKEYALRQIAFPGVKLAAVAAHVGFSDSAVFTRAFRRWTGSTPSRWQARTSQRLPA